MGPLLLLTAACSSPHDSGPRDTGDPWPGPDTSTYRTSLATAGDLGALEGEERDVKYTAPVDGLPREAPILEDAYLQDMAVWPWHLPFLRAFRELRDLDLETYEAWVVENPTRRWWGGGLRLWLGTPHPATGLAGVLSVTFWADDSGEGPTVAHVAEVVDRVAEVAPWSAGLAVWVPDGDPERALAAAEAEALAAAGIPWVLPEALGDALAATVLAAGAGEGTLRIGTATDGEVLVAEAVPEAPPALAALVVAGADPKDPAVVDLAARGVPVAVSAAAVGSPLVAALAGSPVRVTAADGTLDLHPCRPESDR